jgi:competence protein ComEC
VWIAGDFIPVKMPFNPFSWSGWLWRGKISSECKARFVSRALKGDELSLKKDLSGYFNTAKLLYSLRDSLRISFLEKFNYDEGAGLFLAMTLGYQDLISVPLERSFMRLGLTHLLVVSGYQVSLVFTAVLGVMTSFSSVMFSWVRFGGALIRRLVIGASMLLAVLYVFFIGLEMSAVRALIAAGCVCARLVSERESAFMQRWGVALLLMQIVWPWCAFDIGVVLTFSALLGIGLGSELAKQFNLPSFLAVSVAVWLCTSIVLVAWQGGISPLGLLVNLVIAAPWSIVNCTLGLFALCLFYSGMPGGQYLLSIVVGANYSISRIVLYLGELDMASFELTGVGRVGVILALASSWGWLLWRVLISRRVELG